MFLSYRMCGSDASYRRKWWKRYTNYGTIELVIALYGEKEVFYGSRNTCILQVDLSYALRLGNAFFADYRVVIGLDGLLYRHFARAVGSDQISAAHADNLRFYFSDPFNGSCRRFVASRCNLSAIVRKGEKRTEGLNRAKI